MDSLINEVNEDVRRDQMLAIWRQYGRLITTAIVAIIVATAAVSGWKYYQRQAAAAASEQFISIMEKGRGLEVAAALEAYAADAPRAYRTIARFQQAGMLTEANQPDAALAVYQALIDDGGLSPAYGHLARLYAATILLDQGKAEAARDTLAPTLTDNGPYAVSGRELYTLASLRTGDVQQAQTELEKTMADQDALPQSRQRAQQLLYLIDAALKNAASRAPAPSATDNEDSNDS